MIKYEDWGTIDYQTAWDRQKVLFNERIQAKFTAEGNTLPNIAVFCEHPHVFTLGKSGDVENMLAGKELLKARGATFIKIDRGGDITYHGPGQIVLYPIIDLEQFNIGLKQYIHMLEETVIRFMALYGVKGERLEGATGVWLDPHSRGKERKICAIGVKSSRFVTMHGLALNINTDLSYFNLINPCGFTDKGVTSLRKETGKEYDIEDCCKKLYQIFNEVFGK